MLRIFKKYVNSCKSFHHRGTMACSRFEYVKDYEKEDNILPNVWIVVRVDGKGFHKFSKIHDFDKPNDSKALNLMNAAATAVMEEFNDIILSYGQSDEYSFVFRKEANVYNRRASKLLSYVTSLFTSTYVMQWSQWFGANRPLKYAPCFDGRIVLYPSDQNLRDYLSWRQADVHVNNLYNTAFWNLVLHKGLSNQEAESTLRGTFSADKNEILYKDFNINYNDLPAMFRKGTILLRKKVLLENSNRRQLIVPFHEDLIKETFWKTHLELLGKYKPGDFDINAEDEIPAIIKMQLLKLDIYKKANEKNSSNIKTSTFIELNS